jgi:two-component system, OmpR family, KDP operon response regulator KdpE
MTNPPEILIIDDEQQMHRLLRSTLDMAGYAVTVAETATEGLRLAASQRFDGIILDLGLPDADGITVLKEVRRWTQYPVIILSVRSSEQDIVEALDAGANDYLTKPFRTEELLARLRSALRVYNATTTHETVFKAGALTVDLDARVVRKNNLIVKLTPTEFSLLALFVRNAGKVLTHHYILQQVWGPKFEEESQYSRVYVGQLRKKLEDDPNHPSLLQTESGIGYRLSVDRE